VVSSQETASSWEGRRDTSVGMVSESASTQNSLSVVSLLSKVTLRLYFESGAGGGDEDAKVDSVGVGMVMVEVGLYGPWLMNDLTLR